MNYKSKTFLAAGIISLLGLAIPNWADANARNRQKKLDKAAQHELRKDRAELQRDRRDLDRLYRNGGSRSDIYRKRAEIRDDLREVYQDRGQFGRYNDSRRDYGRYNDRGWWGRNNNNSWGNWRRTSDRDRHYWDYRHD